MSATAKINMTLKGLVLMTLVVAYTEVVSADYPPIIQAKPEQIHLSYGTTPTQMIVTWSVKDQTKESFILYGTGGRMTNQAIANMTKQTDESRAHLVQYASKVVLDNLEPGQTYTYVLGNEIERSERFTFQTQPSGDWSPRLCVFGDLGNVNDRSVPQIQEEVDAGMYDAVIHAGDIAYEMWEQDGQKGDVFMNQIQPIAAYIPYMVCPGNHERSYNFSHYRRKFNMPGDEGTKNLFYSFNMGPVHFIGINTEYWYHFELGAYRVYNQYNWLIKDLKEANKPENRAAQPWIVLFGHRPPYCTNYYDGVYNCSNDQRWIRRGLNAAGDTGLDDVFMDYGVDLTIWAHEHSYERLYPIYNYTMMNTTADHPYTNPKGPVHIISGSAGNLEIQTEFIKDPPAWSAFQTMDYGYTRMNVLNKTHMYLEEVSINQGGKVIDSFTIVQENHGPFRPPGQKLSRDGFSQAEIAQIVKDEWS